MEITRRTALASLAVTIAATEAAAAQDNKPKTPLNQSVCKWCYGNMSLEDLCKNAAPVGSKSVGLLGEHDWATVQKHGLSRAVANGPTSSGDGWNRVENHDRFVKESERLLPLVA